MGGIIGCFHVAECVGNLLVAAKHFVAGGVSREQALQFAADVADRKRVGNKFADNFSVGNEVH